MNIKLIFGTHLHLKVFDSTVMMSFNRHLTFIKVTKVNDLLKIARNLSDRISDVTFLLSLTYLTVMCKIKVKIIWLLWSFLPLKVITLISYGKNIWLSLSKLQIYTGSYISIYVILVRVWIWWPIVTYFILTSWPFKVTK